MRTALAVAGTSVASLSAPPLLAYAADPQTRDVIAKLLADRKLSPSLVLEGGIAAALRQSDPVAWPALLIVDVSTASAPAADVAALASACGPDTRIVALGDVNDVALFRDLLGAGAADYLVKPIKPHLLQAALAQIGRADAAAHSAKLGRVAVFIGSRGGVGTTTAAVNAAWLLANEMEQRVALVDFDLHFGTVALALDIDPGRGLREAMERPSRIDTLFIERALVKESERLSILAAEEPLQEGGAFDPAAPEILLHELRRQFDWTVIDLPRGAGALQCQVLAAANQVVVFCELSLAGIRDTMRVQTLVHECAPGATILLAAGATSSAGTKVSAADFERSTGHGIDFTIPYDIKGATAAANAGRALPIAARDSKAVQTLRLLTRRLIGVAPQKVPFWRRRKGQ